MIDGHRMNAFLDRAERVLERLEASLPAAAPAIDWHRALAFRWQIFNGQAELRPVYQPHYQSLTDLLHIDRQKAILDRNTRQFIQELPANNALLWGARGTGKSSLIKALLPEYGDQGLRIIEVDKNDLIYLPHLIDRIAMRPERFLVFSDDLSFAADDASYKTLKAMLDGSVYGQSSNILIYATSNRRHLLPEYLSENLEAQNVDGEIHYSETVDEKISLSERFGLWLSFYPFKQDQYLEIIYHWLRIYAVLPEDLSAVRAEALRWALGRGSRSGRSAFQFAKNWAGQQGLK